ncbi:DNA internalization-related competence protein ComEC/Rec2 [Candidatus Omnitrophus magneticus]|uniref:DNA internalization-related competence protein ComEC/Rec2 n=1 Tax=Candidatus Omnitrophus magneticus TaxID=1609969 RepID=A0A0F0CNB4_9BACT|nr:DNA internalization-related competence protein ComEC/Rec2 [Candidatus Omnitrophus magneticus]
MTPITAYYFNIITPGMFLANIIAVPIVFLIMILGSSFIFIASFNIFFWPAAIAGKFLDIIIITFINIMKILSFFPLSYLRTAKPSSVNMLLYYLALTLALVLFYKKKWHAKKIFASFILAAIPLFIWNDFLASRPMDKTRLTFFDVGHADACLIETNKNHVVLIDAGGGGLEDSYDAGRYVIAPYLWQRGIRYIDCIIMTHAHEDHIGGFLYILENFKIGMVVDGGLNTREEYDIIYGKISDIIEKHRIKRIFVEESDILEIPYDLKFLFFNPSKDGQSYGTANNDSIVTKLITINDNSALFTADAGTRAMENMLKYGSLLNADVLKVPHHGGKAGDKNIVEEFFKKIGFKKAVVSKARNKKFSKEIINSFNKNTALYSTGESGAIVLEETENNNTFEIKNWR